MQDDDFERDVLYTLSSAKGLKQLTRPSILKRNSGRKSSRSRSRRATWMSDYQEEKKLLSDQVYEVEEHMGEDFM